MTIYTEAEMREMILDDSEWAPRYIAGLEQEIERLDESWEDLWGPPWAIPTPPNHLITSDYNARHDVLTEQIMMADELAAKIDQENSESQMAPASGLADRTLEEVGERAQAQPGKLRETS